MKQVVINLQLWMLCHPTTQSINSNLQKNLPEFVGSVIVYCFTLLHSDSYISHKDCMYTVLPASNPLFKMKLCRRWNKSTPNYAPKPLLVVLRQDCYSTNQKVDRNILHQWYFYLRQSSSLGVLRSGSSHYLSRDAVQAFLLSKKKTNKTSQTVLSFPASSTNVQLTKSISNAKVSEWQCNPIKAKKFSLDKNDCHSKKNAIKSDCPSKNSKTLISHASYL